MLGGVARLPLLFWRRGNFRMIGNQAGSMSGFPHVKRMRVRKFPKLANPRALTLVSSIVELSPSLAALLMR